MIDVGYVGRRFGFLVEMAELDWLSNQLVSSEIGLELGWKRPCRQIARLQRCRRFALKMGTDRNCARIFFSVSRFELALVGVDTHDLIHLV